MPRGPSRKKIRLPLEAYRAGEAYLVTFCVADRRPVLASTIAPSIAAIVMRHSADNGGPVFVWVLMPDHVHLLVAGATDIVETVRVLKSAITSRVRASATPDFAWQRSFHDHGLRRQESAQEVARYIVENPVRAGLAGRWREWPWSYWFEVKACGPSADDAAPERRDRG